MAASRGVVDVRACRGGMEWLTVCHPIGPLIGAERVIVMAMGMVVCLLLVARRGRGSRKHWPQLRNASEDLRGVGLEPRSISKDRQVGGRGLLMRNRLSALVSAFAWNAAVARALVFALASST